MSVQEINVKFKNIDSILLHLLLRSSSSTSSNHRHPAVVGSLLLISSSSSSLYRAALARCLLILICPLCVIYKIHLLLSNTFLSPLRYAISSEFPFIFINSFSYPLHSLASLSSHPVIIVLHCWLPCNIVARIRALSWCIVHVFVIIAAHLLNDAQHAGEMVVQWNIIIAHYCMVKYERKKGRMDELLDIKTDRQMNVPSVNFLSVLPQNKNYCDLIRHVEI